MFDEVEIVYLGVDAVLEAHAAVLECTVGEARNQLRNKEGL